MFDSTYELEGGSITICSYCGETLENAPTRAEQLNKFTPTERPENLWVGFGTCGRDWTHRDRHDEFRIDHDSEVSGFNKGDDEPLTDFLLKEKEHEERISS